MLVYHRTSIFQLLVAESPWARWLSGCGVSFGAFSDGRQGVSYWEDWPQTVRGKDRRFNPTAPPSEMFVRIRSK